MRDDEMIVQERSRRTALRFGAAALGALALLAFLPEAAGAQIYVVTEPDGSRRFTTEPGPGAEVYMETPNTRPAPTDPGRERYSRLIDSAAGRTGLDPRLVEAVITAESDFRPGAVSAKGARGLMQLMPETASRFGVRDVWDPADNVRGGTRYLRTLLDEFDRLDLALAAYNAGEGAVRRHGGVPPFPETRRYVRRVLSLYRGDGAGH